MNSLEKITLNQEGINRKLEEHTRILSDDGMLSEDDKESLKATRKEIQDFLVEKN